MADVGLPVDIAEMIREVKREVRMRKDVYGRAAGNGEMSDINKRRIVVMESVLAVLERQELANRAQKELL